MLILQTEKSVYSISSLPFKTHLHFNIRLLKRKPEATSISSTVHVRRRQRVSWRLTSLI